MLSPLLECLDAGRRRASGGTEQTAEERKKGSREMWPRRGAQRQTHPRTHAVPSSRCLPPDTIQQRRCTKHRVDLHYYYRLLALLNLQLLY
ncbi:hypothetical protein GUJ93_ZPchr0006g46403 [Zizania palustris]|uniref:Uncharacterized protein n=1 Tax=Zizania palustris TaxID=103762 RepID=A0A8J5SZX1_ZIZPA|nr:hypothetical protein GUJ93_ZPchr0006g46403 [Zizania palustris]